MRAFVKIGYGSAGLGDSALYGVFATFFLFFLTDVAGVPPAIAGGLITVGTLWDAVTDPLVGYLSDSSTSAYGRRRPFMLIFAFPLGVASWLIFTDFDLTPTGTIVYYLAMLLVYFTVYTLFYVPWTALGAEITTDYDERSSLMSYKMAWAALGAILGGAVPLILVEFFRRHLGSEKSGWSAMAATLGLAATCSIIASWGATKGFEPASRSSKRPQGWLRAFARSPRVVWDNRPFRYVAALFSLSIMADALWASYIVYFGEYWMRLTPEQISFVWLVIFTASLPWLPAINHLSHRLGKRTSYALFVGSWAILNSLMLVLVPSSFPLLCVLVALSAGGWAATWTLGWAMISDVVEVDEFKTGERREGLYFGVTQFLQKLATGAVLFAGGSILSLVGYVPKAGQTETALFGIRLTLSLGVSILLGTAVVFALLFPITKKKHTALRRAIELRKEGQAFDTDEFADLLG